MVFGKSCEEIGSSTKELILKSSGKIKLQWGNKFIDLLDKNGNINSKQKDPIIKVESEKEMLKPGIYYLTSKNLFVIYFDENTSYPIKIDDVPEEKKVEEAVVKPTSIYENRNFISKIEQVNDFYYTIYFGLKDYLYQQGDIIVFYIDYMSQILPIYFTIFEYNYSDNSAKVFISSGYERRSFDYSLLISLTNIECFLFSYIKKENIKTGEEEMNSSNDSLKIGKLDSEKYRADIDVGIVSKQNIFYSTQFDYDSIDSDEQYPKYTSKLLNQLEQEEEIDDNTIVPYGIIKKLLENN